VVEGLKVASTDAAAARRAKTVDAHFNFIVFRTKTTTRSTRQKKLRLLELLDRFYLKGGALSGCTTSPFRGCVVVVVLEILFCRIAVLANSR
jgi:hypothetical protein